MFADSLCGDGAHLRASFFPYKAVRIFALALLTALSASLSASAETGASLLKNATECNCLDDGDLFTYCPQMSDIQAYEFQLRLDVSHFSSAKSISQAAETFFETFLSASNGAVISNEKKYKESLFHERSWYLTESDGTPFPTDCMTTPVYRESSYVRTREEREVEDGALEEKVKIKAALKVRDVDPEKFKQPDKDISDDMECDIYSDQHRSTYESKVKDLVESVSFETFGAVLNLFPWAPDYFCLDMSLSLPKRDEYYTHRFKWKNLFLYEAEMECSLDLRMREVDEGTTVGIPYAGEFSCSVEPEEILDALQNVRQTLDSLKHVFTRVHLSSSWVHQSPFGTSSRIMKALY